MGIDQILKTKEEAERFIESIQEMLEHRAQSGNECNWIHGKYAANIKRKSMDLTRSLAVLRGADK